MFSPSAPPLCYLDYLAYTIYPRVHHIHPTRASRPIFIFKCDSTITPSHKSISFRLCSWTCVLDFSLLRGASVLYASQSLVPGLWMHPFGFPFAPAHPALACITPSYWPPPCPRCTTAHIPLSYIRTPSSSCYRASFLTRDTSGISCRVCRFIRHAFDNFYKKYAGKSFMKVRANELCV